MKSGSVLVDVAIDQGGCFETSRATTHDSPIFKVNNIVHYCVANMPGAVPNTSTLALSHATAPLIVEIANRGWKTACLENHNLLNGSNIHDGQVTNKAVAMAQRLNFLEPQLLLDA